MPMTAEMVSRTVSMIACATTLSLFSTILAIGTVNATALKWDGTFCVKKTCSSAIAHSGEAIRAKPVTAQRFGKAT
jgi:hypothetical protein